jgi:hypothetical protein
MINIRKEPPVKYSTRKISYATQRRIKFLEEDINARAHFTCIASTSIEDGKLAMEEAEFRRKRTELIQYLLSFWSCKS